MSKHNSIYNILGKLSSLEPKQESILKTLNESREPNPLSLADRLNEKFATFKEGKGSKPDFLDMDKDGNKKEPMKKAISDKKKNPFAKKVDESEVEEDMIMSPRDKKFAKLAPPKDKITYADKIAGAKMHGKKETDEGEYQDTVNKSKVPAFQRKAKAQPGDQSWKVSAQDLDDEQSKSPTSSAGLAKAKARLGMQEGWDDMLKAVKDNKGTGKFDSQKTSTGTRYTRKSETFSDDSDSNEKSSSDAPKKRGRPAKNKGPERTTSKAYKHKGSRVSETKINIATFVEETMAELEGILVTEKAVSKAQQKFMGMVHAAQKGEKAASPEVAKVAKTMGKKDAEDFASTKHKGLPQHVKESVQLTENLDAIKHRYGKEVKTFMSSGMMDPDLYHALHDHYYDDMPASVKRGNDTQEWVKDHFHNDMGGIGFSAPDSLSTLPTKIDIKSDHELDELAHLAGLGNRTGSHGACNHTPEGVECPEHGIMECGALWESEEKPDYIDIDKDGDKEEPMKKAAEEADDKEKVDECDMGSPPAESGVSVNTSMDTKTGRKSVTVTADGEAAEQLAAMLKMAGLGGAGHAAAEPEEEHATIVIANPEEQGEEQEVEEEYANDPHEEYVDTDVILSQGQDLNRPKKQYKHSYRQSDNPMAMQENALEGRLASLYNSIKVKSK